VTKLRYLFPVVLLSLVAANAFAVCTAPVWRGPTGVGGGAWYDYTQPQSSYSINPAGSPINTVTSIPNCSNEPGWDFGGTSWGESEETCFVLDSSTPFFNSTKWSADMAVYFVTTGTPSTYDTLRLYAIVTHPGGTQNSYTLFSWNGALGNITDCQPRGTGYFTANVGDTVTIRVRATNLSGGATIQTGVPHVFNQF
jgi:hypothetical protein